MGKLENPQFDHHFPLVKDILMLISHTHALYIYNIHTHLVIYPHCIILYTSVYQLYLHILVGLSRYRRQRLAELKAARASARFGELRQLCRASYVQEVTEASAGGQWVLLLLYTDVTCLIARCC